MCVGFHDSGKWGITATIGMVMVTNCIVQCGDFVLNNGKGKPSIFEAMGLVMVMAVVTGMGMGMGMVMVIDVRLYLNLW